MIALHPEISAHRNSELRARATAHRRARGARIRRRPSPIGPSGALEQISIRRLDLETGDREALKRVAGRDSAAVPAGEVLGAELGGRLIAAISLSSGELVADPFTPSADARSLLELRATQLGRAHSEPAGSGLRSWRRAGHSADGAA